MRFLCTTNHAGQEPLLSTLQLWHAQRMPVLHMANIGNNSLRYSRILYSIGKPTAHERDILYIKVIYVPGHHEYKFAALLCYAYLSLVPNV